MHLSSDRIVAGIVRAREEARVSVDVVTTMAEEFATLDSDLQASTDQVQRSARTWSGTG
jgi:hypothetical protein